MRDKNENWVAIRPMRLALLMTSLVALGLSACGDRNRHAEGAPPSAPGARGNSASPTAAPAERSAARVPTPRFHGEPLWAENRRGTAEENAKYQFERRGGDVGAHSLDDYLTKVHAFFDHPPAGAEIATRARNGDRLIYDPKSNLFGVQRKDGAPRLLMVAPTGRSYWEAQKSEIQSSTASEGR